MLMVSLNNGIVLPKDIIDAFKSSDNKKLCSIFRSVNNAEIGTRELRTTKFDLELISKIINQDGWQKEGGEFIIIDDKGNSIYKSSKCEIEITKGENGYLYINGDELVLHSHEEGFIQGKTKEDLDKNYKRQVKLGFYNQDKNFGKDGFVMENEKKEEVAFKDTIMGKMTKGAIFEWGENNENGEWFVPTEEQADAILSEGGLSLGEGHLIDYSSSEKATNNKTYGSEVAAIDGIVDLVAKKEGITDEEKATLVEQIKTDIYTKSYISPDIAARISIAMEDKGVEASIVEILGTIHDNWVKGNGNKFDDPKRAKKLYQFTDLRMMSYGGDGATADLLFLQPILEGAGIEVDRDGKLKEEFLKQQKEYMEENGITDTKGLRDYLSNLEENYPAIQGVTTTKGKTVEPVKITDELQKEDILERMTEQVAGKAGIKYEKTEPTVEESAIEEPIAEETIDQDTVTPEEIAKLDKEQALTKTEAGGIKGFFKRLLDKLKGKGEK